VHSISERALRPMKYAQPRMDFGPGPGTPFLRAMLPGARTERVTASVSFRPQVAPVLALAWTPIMRSADLTLGIFLCSELFDIHADNAGHKDETSHRPQAL